MYTIDCISQPTKSVGGGWLNFWNRRRRHQIIGSAAPPAENSAAHISSPNTVPQFVVVVLEQKPTKLICWLERCSYL